ncbi:hypothetical protein [Sporosarcina sp. FSL K6-3508]|uniref:hypothetical protein n=1 Tax=Sporosarcina sp. FSL K6-3508 TaxID=2921557 RepID=UPI00315A4902
MIRSGTKSDVSDTESVKSDMKNVSSGTERKKSEQFSDRELADLMGTNRDTYRRGPGGAIRRR